MVAVSFPKGRSSGKIGVTARQPMLGKIDWINNEVKAMEAPKEEKK
jgi:DNA-directed RNA polymerase subunit E'/Rpb7